MYDFLHLMAPHLTRRLVDRAAACRMHEEVDVLFWSPLKAQLGVRQ
jgi:hypothetical protein